MKESKASRATKRDGVTRERLNRERVLTAAIEVADRDGLDSLTMRRLGEELGVEAMSIYAHVANKDDLLTGMVDTIFAGIELPSLSDDWRTAIRKRSVSFRDALSRHPWATSVKDSGTSPGPATLRHLDMALGTLRNGGLSLALTAHAISAIDSYVYGFSMREKTLPFKTEEEIPIMTQILLTELPTAEYPYLAELTANQVLQPGYHYANEFEFGLDLMLDAIARERD
ncbi:TetR family transcriptional regulator [Cryobacterium sp. TMT2-15-1]|uniref:TetR/AcrR family transcriptional regulator C-terminal domain-containing protein n=1 Tax=Cryobacterium sp. TMT2-15-1 TaxID=1259246 RepID=UPI00106ADC03|nr:TetR/AcrR family transcriptional regulator C-terminal domain-containing protein [Cryobacterium sp. TMT2-15-1]TFC55432.1 TetR family transcriptional regulator [Cryobacterium sp. TMT2-15-1]